MIADTPKPPYYAVIFTSVRAGDDPDYGQTAGRMVQLAFQQPGFLGVEHAGASSGITVSYWKDLDSIRAWKNHAEHMEAQRRGREGWYEAFKTRIALVERDYALAD